MKTASTKRKGISVAARKAKGRNLQKWIRGKIIDIIGVNEEDIKSCPMGSNGEDIILARAARELFPYTVEAKHQETAKVVYDWMNQSKYHAKKGIEPIVIFKRNHCTPLAIMDAEYFLQMQHQLNNTGE